MPQSLPSAGPAVATRAESPAPNTGSYRPPLEMRPALVGMVTLAHPLVTEAEAVATDTVRHSTPIYGQCGITLDAGHTTRLELTGRVDWSTGTIELLGRATTADPHLGRILPAAGALTRREGEVARLLEQGASNAYIAATLAISPHTARRHTESVMLKLGVNSRAQVGALLRGAVVAPSAQPVE